MSLNERVLFLDAYDSFSHNIIALLESRCGLRVTRIYIDSDIPDFEEYLQQFAAVVCGPGPGHPACINDVGLFKRIWSLPEERVLPVLGICLGFQSLAYEFGASINRLLQPRHGVKTLVTSSSQSIFKGLPYTHSIQYHSLFAQLYHRPELSDVDHGLWAPSDRCPQLQPLAWDFSSQNDPDSVFRSNPPAILMAVKHTTKPFYGLQFHPESISSEISARKIVIQWWQEALKWLTEQTRSGCMPMSSSNSKSNALKVVCPTRSSAAGLPRTPSVPAFVPSGEQNGLRLISVSLPRNDLTVPSVCELLNLQKEDCIVLDSEMRQLPQLGEASIIGIIDSRTNIIRYSVGSNIAIVSSGSGHEQVNLQKYDHDIFTFLQKFMADHAIEINDDRVFCGGLMGYISYEACLETIGIHPRPSADHPDLCFAFVQRSVLIEHKRDRLIIQELLDASSGTSSWVSQTSTVLEKGRESGDFTRFRSPSFLSIKTAEHSLPSQSEYQAKIAQSKGYIAAGESYELCLTDQTRIRVAAGSSAWDMYKELRTLNPANFGAYVRLGRLTLLSTSPEQFMKWSRFQRICTPGDNMQESTCHFRPMKGTVRKHKQMPDGTVHFISCEEAESILRAPKEYAENLMILDLIRHDLYSICQQVSVPDLMVIEEYESVYQMVSVVEGTICKPAGLGPFDGKSGLSCLAASLPPGSMTGAPKKRSCQLLQSIEKKPRSLYSGVLGYIDASGQGNFSVLIRSMYTWNDETDSSNDKHDTWNIGAGGAITMLSTEQDEWEEMLAKLQSTYRLFQSGP